MVLATIPPIPPPRLFACISGNVAFDLQCLQSNLNINGWRDNKNKSFIKGEEDCSSLTVSVRTDFEAILPLQTGITWIFKGGIRSNEFRISFPKGILFSFFFPFIEKKRILFWRICSSKKIRGKIGSEELLWINVVLYIKKEGNIWIGMLNWWYYYSWWVIYTDLLTNCLINRVSILMEMRKIVRMDFLSFSLLFPFMEKEKSFTDFILATSEEIFFIKFVV